MAQPSAKKAKGVAKSEANIADAPSRNNFVMLEKVADKVDPVLPSILSWEEIFGESGRHQ